MLASAACALIDHTAAATAEVRFLIVPSSDAHLDTRQGELEDRCRSFDPLDHAGADRGKKQLRRIERVVAPLDTSVANDLAVLQLARLPALLVRPIVTW